jgi:hypothetical protein
MKLLVLLDKLVNAVVLMGRKWETISARSWEAKVEGKAWGQWAVRVIDGLFGQGHCEAAARG